MAKKFESKLHYVSIAITSTGDEPIADLIAGAFAQVNAARQSGKDLDVNIERPTGQTRIQFKHEPATPKLPKSRRKKS